MVRGRMKHKDVVETLHHSDWDIFKENFNRFWNENVKPYERTLLTLLTAIVVLGVGYLWYSDKKANDLESANQYLAEAKYGDELRIELAVDNLREKSFELVYRISNLSRDCEMARVVTTLLFFDYQRTCVVPVPEAFLERVGVVSRQAAGDT